MGALGRYLYSLTAGARDRGCKHRVRLRAWSGALQVELNVNPEWRPMEKVLHLGVYLVPMCSYRSCGPPSLQPPVEILGSSPLERQLVALQLSRILLRFGPL